MTPRSIVCLSVLLAVAVVASSVAWLLGFALDFTATWWVAGGATAVVCLVAIAVAVRSRRARRSARSTSRFVLDDTTGITIGGLSIEEYLAREAVRKG